MNPQDAGACNGGILPVVLSEYVDQYLLLHEQAYRGSAVERTAAPAEGIVKKDIDKVLGFGLTLESSRA